MDIPFNYNECEECIYTENLQDEVVELKLENEILKKENMSLKKALSGMAKENKGYRDTVDRLKVAIEKYEREVK